MVHWQVRQVLRADEPNVGYARRKHMLFVTVNWCTCAQDVGPWCTGPFDAYQLTGGDTCWIISGLPLPLGVPRQRSEHAGRAELMGIAPSELGRWAFRS